MYKTYIPLILYAVICSSHMWQQCIAFCRSHHTSESQWLWLRHECWCQAAVWMFLKVPFLTLSSFINMTVAFSELQWHPQSQSQSPGFNPVDHLQDVVEQQSAADSSAEMMRCSHVNMDINKLTIIKSSCFSADVVSVSSQHDAIISSGCKVHLQIQMHNNLYIDSFSCCFLFEPNKS